MPRSRGGPAPARSAPSRPQAAPARSAPPPQQRQMSTTAQPPARAQAPPAQASQSPGLFGQMASTAAGVAVGSSIGHAIGGFFGGGSSAPAQQEYQQPVDQYQQPGQMYQTNTQTEATSGPCANDVNQFTKCMNTNNGDLNICGWYLEQLKACQQAAAPY